MTWLFAISVFDHHLLALLKPFATPLPAGGEESAAMADNMQSLLGEVSYLRDQVSYLLEEMAKQKHQTQLPLSLALELDELKKKVDKQTSTQNGLRK